MDFNTCHTGPPQPDKWHSKRAAPSARCLAHVTPLGQQARTQPHLPAVPANVTPLGQQTRAQPRLPVPGQMSGKMSRHARAQPHLPVLQAHDKPRQSVHRHIRLQGKQPQTGARGLQVRWCDAAISQQAWRAWAWQQAAPPCRMSAPAAERCRAAAPGATTVNAAQRPSISCSPAAGRCRAAAPCRCTWSAPPPRPR